MKPASRPVIVPDRPRPRPPAHLAKAGRALWRAVTADFDLDDGHSREQLAIACEAADRAAEARDAIATHGLLLEGRFGLKQNPAVAIERDARIRQLRALRELGLDLDVAETRPPTTWRGRTR